MDKNFFPPDVSLRLRGDRATAQSHIGEARKLLFKALNIDKRPTSLVQHMDDGSTIHVLLAGNQKIVNIEAAPPVVPAEELPPTPPPKVVFPPGKKRPYMLSGWTRHHAYINDALHEFHPSRVCSNAYRLPYSWQDVSKLKVGSSPQLTIKPSNYSGIMKRVAQAVLGLGKISDSGPSYITDTVIEGEREVPLVYNFQWSFTHGVYKAGPKNHWLVGIGLFGMLAMPLPLLSSTKSAAFREAMVRQGDTDTIKVLDEFGGLPSGESFPTSEAAVNLAVAQGKVVRLLTSTEVEPFYTGHLRYSSDFGWAFSETGNEIHNTNWTTKTEGALIALYGEHWRITFSLSVHDVNNLKLQPAAPVGTGSATLERVHSGRIDWFGFDEMLVPDGFGLRAMSRNLSDNWAQYATLDNQFNIFTAAYNVPVEEWGCDVFVFYDGDRLERVKWVPSLIMVYGRGTRLEELQMLAPASWANDECRYMYEALMSAQSPHYRSVNGNRSRFSPRGFAGSLDVRVACITRQAPFSPNEPRIYPNYQYASNTVWFSVPGAGDPINEGPCLRIDAVTPTGVEDVVPFVVGNEGLAFSSGPGIEQKIWLICPSGCREGYVLVSRRVDTSPEGSTATYSGGTVGFFGGVGTLGFRHSVNENFYLSGGPSYAPRFIAAVSARQTQYHMDDGVLIPSVFLERPTRVSAPVSGLDDISTDRMNWVGAPD